MKMHIPKLPPGPASKPDPVTRHTTPDFFQKSAPGDREAGANPIMLARQARPVLSAPHDPHLHPYRHLYSPLNIAGRSVVVSKDNPSC